MLKKCFGIVSYFPWNQPERKQRQDRLDRLLKQLSQLWPDIPVIIISQQWKWYNPEKICKNKLIRFDYPKLGILNARQKLREHFLASDFDYLIMFDDDAIIECDNSKAAKEYMDELDKHPGGFCFIKGKGSSNYTDYNDSQLNLCAISKPLYRKEPIPNVDPQNSEAFEDRIWSTLLHFKYAKKEFDAPKTIRCIHFRNAKEIAPSTWSNEKQYNWRRMRYNTTVVEDYIATYKDLPDLDLILNKKADKDGNNYIQLLGNCSDIGYLGNNRIKGPVDNVLTKGVNTLEELLNNTYLESIKKIEPKTFWRKKSFDTDQNTGYDYTFGQILHNNPTEKKYVEELSERIRTFNTFYYCVTNKENYYFVVCLNMYDIDNETHNLCGSHFEDIIKYLKDKKLLDKTIFVQTKELNIPRTANWCSEDADKLAEKYNIKMITITDNLIRGPGVDISHDQFIDKVGKLL